MVCQEIYDREQRQILNNYICSSDFNVVSRCNIASLQKNNSKQKVLNYVSKVLDVHTCGQKFSPYWQASQKSFYHISQVKTSRIAWKQRN